MIKVCYFKFKTSPEKLVARLREMEHDAKLCYHTGDELLETTNDDFVVNWGYADRIWKTHKCLDLNNRNTFEDKEAQKRCLVDAGVKSPRVFGLGRWPGIPVVLRNRSHHGGQDAKYVATADEFRQFAPNFDGYCTEFVDKVREFRAHQTKQLGTLFITEKRIRNHNLLVWNNANEVVVRGENELRERISAIAKLALDAVRYDFGGVDIMLDGRGTLWVLEVNSAPALETDYALNKYASYVTLCNA